MPLWQKLRLVSSYVGEEEISETQAKYAQYYLNMQTFEGVEEQEWYEGKTEDWKYIGADRVLEYEKLGRCLRQFQPQMRSTNPDLEASYEQDM